jgi:choline-sulfatase
MSTMSRVLEASARVGRSVLGASVAGLLAAVVDAAWARGAASAGPGRAAVHVYLAAAGLIAPIAIAVGLAAGVAGLVADPDAPPSPARFMAALRVRAIGRPATAAFVPLAVLGAFFWMTFSAHLARALLAAEVRPQVPGVAVAAGTLALGLLAALGVLALTPALRHRIATASEGWPVFVDPVFTGVAALFAAAALFAFGVATGSVSGDGGFFGIWGIFKRPELDLRASGMILAIGLGGFFAPAALPRARASIALALGLAPVLLTIRAGAALAAAPAVAVAIDRGAALAKPALSVLRRATARERDSAPPPGADLVVPPTAKPSPPVVSATAPRPSATAPVDRPPTPKPAIPPDLNVVLVTVDTMRAELHYAGNPRELSPSMDRLAAESVVFDRMYSLASYTGKSVGPMLIGKYGSETHRNWGHSNSFTREDTFVAERLQRAGVHTMAVHALRYFGAQSGMNRGFDVVDMKATGDGTIKEMENSITGDKLTDATLALLAKPESTSGRFFLWMHYLDPHADYMRHPEMPSFGTSQRDLYDGEIAFVDRHLGRVLEAIAAAPWGKRTAILVTSDHGEAFGEHKMWRHGTELWEELIHVPFILHVPGAAPAHVAARRSAIDLVPTILELMGVAPPSGPGANDFIDGVSLLPDAFLGPGAQAETRDVFVDMPDGPFNDPRRALFHGDLKLTVSNGVSFELYDLAKDPEERQNLWEDDGPAAKEIAALYAAQKARLHEVRVTGDHP